jgi:hypothetical protein
VDRAVLKDAPRPADNHSSTGVAVKHEEHSQDEFSDKSDVRGEVRETTEVFGIPRDRWGCQNLAVNTSTALPSQRVRVWTGRPGERGSIPGRGKGFFL